MYVSCRTNKMSSMTQTKNPTFRAEIQFLRLDDDGTRQRRVAGVLVDGANRAEKDERKMHTIERKIIIPPLTVGRMCHNADLRRRKNAVPVN